MNYEAEKKAALELLGGKFTRFPNPFFITLIKDEGQRSSDGEGMYKAVGPSFWKFLFVLWHEVMWERKEKTNLSASLSLRLFGIHPKDAMLWATAIVAGGLFSIKHKGNFSDRKASIYVYHPADIIAWQGFYRGLMQAWGEWRASRGSNRQYGESMAAWAKLVKIQVDKETAALRANY